MTFNGLDVVVEYRAQSDGTRKIWCVWRDKDVLAIHDTLNAALDDARRIAKSGGCKAWLIGNGEPIEINLDTTSAPAAESETRDSR